MGCASSSPAPGAGEATKEEPVATDPRMARINAAHSVPTASFSLGSSSFVVRYACVSQRGYNPDDLYEANQDAYTVVRDLKNPFSDEPQLLLGVFDGGGVEGSECAQWVRREVGGALEYAITKTPEDYSAASKAAMIVLNQQLIMSDDIDASYSGTTALTAWLHGSCLHVCNVGDSRAVMGERRGKKVAAYALSVDQTPFRKDERERLKAAGAVIMSRGMMEADHQARSTTVRASTSNERVSKSPDQRRQLRVSWEEGVNKAEQLQRTSNVSQRRSTVGPGMSPIGMSPMEALDEEAAPAAAADPPLVYKKGARGPGLKHTRSLGEDIWQRSVGISAQGEVTRKELREQDQFLILGSDGLWEFLSNQAVCDRVKQFDEPLAACKAVIAEAYSLWLQFEVRTDDITVVIAFIDTKEGPAPRAPSDAEVEMFEAEGKSTLAPYGGLQNDRRTGVDFRMSMAPERETVAAMPSRGALNSENRARLTVHMEGGGESSNSPADEEAIWDDEDEILEGEPKSEEEIDRIAAAVASNFLFSKIPAEKARQIFACMRKRVTFESEILFEQGEMGHTFYVLEEGEYVVSLQKEGEQDNTDLFTYEAMHPHAPNPCFGELALMYAAKRPVTVTCASEEGVLWEIDRSTFRKVMSRSSKDVLQRTLRAVEVLRGLTVAQMDMLAESLAQRSYQPGEVVIRQGEIGTTFYIIAEGRARITRGTNESEEEELLIEISAGEYFGERALLQHEPRAATVTATGDAPLKVLYVSKEAFEEVLGPLQTMISDYSQWRYQVAAAKEFVKNAAGVAKCTVDDFMFEGICVQEHPFQYVLASLGARGFTVKAASKRRLHKSGLRERVQREVDLLDIVTMHKRFCPLPLTTIEDDAYLYSVLPTRVSLSLSALLEIKKGTLDEDSALFYAACAALALNHLHAEHAAYAGGIIYRNLSPDSLVLDEYGYLQLVDYRNATKADPPPKDYVGYAHYFSPEQVRGFGHGWASDYWGLGTLLYEMATGANPWLLGEDDSELAIYVRIESHQMDALPFPDGVTLSAFVAKLLNELFEPTPAARLGVRDPGGFAELQAHTAFEKIDWARLAEGDLLAPHRMLCAGHVEDLEKKAASHGDGEGYKRSELLPEKPPDKVKTPPKKGVNSLKTKQAVVAARSSKSRQSVDEQISARLLSLGDAKRLPEPLSKTDDANDDSSRSFLHDIMENLVQVSRRLNAGVTPEVMEASPAPSSTPGVITSARSTPKSTPRVVTAEVRFGPAAAPPANATPSNARASQERTLAIIGEEDEAEEGPPAARRGASQSGNNTMIAATVASSKESTESAESAESVQIV